MVIEERRPRSFLLLFERNLKRYINMLFNLLLTYNQLLYTTSIFLCELLFKMSIFTCSTLYHLNSYLNLCSQKTATTTIIYSVEFQKCSMGRIKCTETLSLFHRDREIVSGLVSKGYK